MKMMKSLAKDALRGAGIEVRRINQQKKVIVPEATESQKAILDRVKPFTMTSVERIWSCMEAARYVSARGLDGDFVECGVWRGGSTMASALTFLELGDASRTMWLFDTFEGMTEPVAADVSAITKKAAADTYETVKTDEGSDWCYAGLDEVRANLAATGYPADKLRFVKGKVEETLADPANIPEKISVLRLDTDWYESTKVELETLFDKLQPGGVLIIDDYGHWAGAKKAVDEFFADYPQHYMLHRIDVTARALIKA